MKLLAYGFCNDVNARGKSFSPKNTEQEVQLNIFKFSFGVNKYCHDYQKSKLYHSISSIVILNEIYGFKTN